MRIVLLLSVLFYLNVVFALLLPSLLVVIGLLRLGELFARSIHSFRVCTRYTIRTTTVSIYKAYRLLPDASRLTYLRFPMAKNGH